MAKWRVLAIERNWRIRKLIRANLEALGLEVREAVSGEHGLQQLGNDLPDLILLDLDLPDDDALQLLYALHGRMVGKRVPIVIMAPEPPSRRFIQHGMIAGHLLKPFAVPALLEQVQKVLGNLPLSDSASSLGVGAQL
jgi:CheY-like chemotaxis protein